MLFSCCLATGVGIRYFSSSLFQIPRKRANMKIKVPLIAATRRENREDLENAPQINPKMEPVCNQCNRLKTYLIKTTPSPRRPIIGKERVCLKIFIIFISTRSLKCTYFAISYYQWGLMFVILLNVFRFMSINTHVET